MLSFFKPYFNCRNKKKHCFILLFAAFSKKIYFYLPDFRKDNIILYNRFYKRFYDSVCEREFSMKEINKKRKTNVFIIKQNFSLDIKLEHAGVEDNPHHTLNSPPINRYVLSYLTRGKGEYRLNGRHFTLQAGDVYYIPQSAHYFQKVDENDPYSYFFVAFYGTECKDILEHAGFTPENPVISAGNYGEFMETKFREIVKCCKINTFASLVRANILLYEVLLHFIELREENNVKREGKSRLIEEAQEFMRTNYSEITTADVSRHIFVNPTYFSSLFKKICGITPHRYLINVRIGAAMNLLLNTNLSAYKIAERVGFADYPNFYKRFKDKVGSSPAKYRRDHMKDYDIMDSSDASVKNNTPPPEQNRTDPDFDG